MKQIVVVASLLLCSQALATPSHTTVPLDPSGFVIAWHVSQWGKAVVQQGPDIDLHNELEGRILKKAQRKGRKYTLQSRLVAKKDGPIRFKMGCTRKCTLMVDGRNILTVDKPYRAFLDDSEVELNLTAGTHDMVVQMHRQVRGKTHRQRIFLRLHDQNNRVPDWIYTQVAGDLDEARALAAALSLKFTQKIESDHLALTLEAGPSARFEKAVEVVLGSASRVVTHGEKVSLTVKVTTEKQVPWQIENNGQVLRQGQVRVRAEPRFLAAVARARSVLAAHPMNDDAKATLQWGVNHLSELLAEGDKDTKYLQRWADILNRQSAATAAGEDFLSTERGALWRAYRSPLDGNLQPYALFIPKSWKPSRPLPLHVALHPSGFSPMLTLRIAMGHPISRGKRRSERHLPNFVSRGAIVVAPYGYRGTGSRYQGKVDVLEVISRVSSRYSTNPRRVTLSGGSLGGLGSWHIGLRMPDKFNAIVPMAGYGTVRMYGDVAGVKKKPWEHFLVARRDNTTFVENARHLPMLCLHGERDNPRRSEVIVSRYKKRGYRHQFDVLEDTGHNAWDDGYDNGYAFRFARKYSRPKTPARVDFVSGSYRHRSAYWLQIEQFDQHEQLGRLKATLNRKKATIKTQNLRRLSLKLDPPRKVSIDGQKFDESQYRAHWLRASDGLWHPVAHSQIGLRNKRPGMSGPVDDIRYEPHVFVYGTSDPAQTEGNRRRAEHAARYGWNWANIQMPVVPDTAIESKQLMNKHLVLFGNPKSNKVLADLADQLPVKWEGDAIVMGERRFEGSSVGVSFIYPNPLSPNHYILVHAGVSGRGTWLSAWLPRWLPDFVVYDNGISVQRGGRLMDKRKPLWAGYFDRKWRLSE